MTPCTSARTIAAAPGRCAGTRGRCWGKESSGSCSGGQVKVLFAENQRAEALNDRVFLPFLRSEAGFPAGLLEKSFAIPAVRCRHLRQKQTTRVSLAHQEPVPADFDFEDILHELHRRQHRDLELDAVQLGRHHRHEPRIAYSRSNRTLGDASIKRARGVDVSNTAPELALLMN